MLGLIVVPVAIILFFAAVSVLARRNEQAFRNRWPAISDEEFLAKCSPGTSPQRALRVRRIVSEQLGVRYAHIHPEQSFVDDLNC